MKSELRVHGVSGTQPRDMLYTDPVLRDPVEPNERRYTDIHRVPPADTEFDTQAFHWGRIDCRQPTHRLLDPVVALRFRQCRWMDEQRSQEPIWSRHGPGRRTRPHRPLRHRGIHGHRVAPLPLVDVRNLFDVMGWTIEFGPGLKDRGLLLALDHLDKWSVLTALRRRRRPMIFPAARHR